jgi:hypothetical protein
MWTVLSYHEAGEQVKRVAPSLEEHGHAEHPVDRPWDVERTHGEHGHERQRETHDGVPVAPDREHRGAEEEAEPEEVEQIAQDRMPVAQEEGRQRLLGRCMTGRRRAHRSRRHRSSRRFRRGSRHPTAAAALCDGFLTRPLRVGARPGRRSRCGGRAHWRSSLALGRVSDHHLLCVIAPPSAPCRATDFGARERSRPG